MSGAHSRIAYEDFTARAAAVTTALREISKGPAEAGLDKGLLELIKTRASQLNGCAFCLQLHLNLARKLGVPAAKLDVVAAWREAGDRFDARERAALAWTETLTRLAPGAASDAEYEALRAAFSEDEALYLTVAIGHINLWNRLGVALRFAPPAVA
jgi:AhpD family alkylhydroperoxidase